MSLIEMERVSRHYRLGETDLVALKDVDLLVEEKEFVAIWGPSGSGKSTLCNLMGGIDTPTSGTVSIDGRDMSQLSDDERSEHRSRCVGFIFQQFNLVQVFSALENVMLPLDLRGEPIGAARSKAMALLDELGIAASSGQRPAKLSGGQRQRVAIARALVTQPRVVIADEPTANLDSGNAERIVDLMRALNKSRGTTFVFSTHDLRLLERVDRRIHLRDGVIAQDTGAEDAKAGGQP